MVAALQRALALLTRRCLVPVGRGLLVLRVHGVVFLVVRVWDLWLVALGVDLSHP